MKVKLLINVILKNPVKLISLLTTIGCLIWYSTTEPHIEKYEYKSEGEVMIDGDEYFVYSDINNNEETFKIHGIEDDYKRIEKGGKIYYTFEREEASYATIFSLVLSALGFLFFLGGHWGNLEYWRGWEYDDITVNYYKKKIIKVVDGDRVYYILNNKVIVEELLDKKYNHNDPIPYRNIVPHIKDYMKNPNLFCNYKGTKSERRNERLSSILDK